MSGNDYSAASLNTRIYNTRCYFNVHQRVLKSWHKLVSLIYRMEMRVQQLITVFVQNLHDIQWYHTSRWISSIKKIPSWWDVLRIWHGYIITQHLMHSTAFLLLMDWHACVCVCACLSVCMLVTIVSPANIAELLKLPFRLQSFVDPRNHILHIVGGAHWWFLVNTMDWSVQRWRCCLSLPLLLLLFCLLVLAVPVINCTLLGTVHCPTYKSFTLSTDAATGAISDVLNRSDVLNIFGADMTVLWHCWLCISKSIWPVKNWVMRCRSSYLSGVRCRLFAYGPADATASQNPIISCLI